MYQRKAITKQFLKHKKVKRIEIGFSLAFADITPTLTKE